MKIHDIIVESKKSNALSERKRKRRAKSRTVYGGWWGGYYGDNSSAEGGGEGVAEDLLNEWVDPGPPCKVCGKPHGQHSVQFNRKNPKLSFINPDDEWNDLEMSNAEDHEYVPSTGYKPLSQKEAELIGFDNLNVSIPDDIYDRINSVRQRISRVGSRAGQLKRVKEGVAEESNDKSIDDITSAFVEHYKEDPVGMFMHAKSSYLDAVGKAKNFSVKAARLYKSHQSMSKSEFQNTVLAHFGPHLIKHGFPKHASPGWGEAERDMMKDLTENVAESTLSWSTLNDSLSVEDKLTIFEEYYLSSNCY